MKTYKIKPTKKQLKIIKQYWKELEKAENIYYGIIMNLEKKMEKETGINGIMFFSCDGSHVGVGNDDRTLPLIHLR
ncbi:MAG: hypothetical protein V1901_03915 [Patescibacteria group bacterium]